MAHWPFMRIGGRVPPLLVREPRAALAGYARSAGRARVWLIGKHTRRTIFAPAPIILGAGMQIRCLALTNFTPSRPFARL